VLRNPHEDVALVGAAVPTPRPWQLRSQSPASRRSPWFRNAQIRVKKDIGQDPWLSFPALPAVYFGRTDDGAGDGTCPTRWRR
jgi:hypothetical protein